MLSQLIQELQSNADEKQAEICKRFFKTEKGQYDEGDVFLGIKVPLQRSIAKKYLNMSLPKIQELLKSKIHEYRAIGLIILVSKYKKASDREKENIFNFYLKNTKRVNNWDLVDISTPKIVGDFLLKRDKNILYKLAHSENLWERRIAIVSTFSFIQKGEFEDALAISEILLDDKHDLINKAVGWMLREVGKCDEEVLENFLRQHYAEMPRTTLRYALEKFNEDKRKRILRGQF